MFSRILVCASLITFIGSDVGSSQNIVLPEDAVALPSTSLAQILVWKYLDAQSTSLLINNLCDTNSVESLSGDNGSSALTLSCSVISLW